MRWIGYYLVLLIIAISLQFISAKSTEHHVAPPRCAIDAVETHANRVSRTVEEFRKVKQKKKKRVTATPPIFEIRLIVHVLMASDGEGYVPLDSIQANVVAANSVLSGAANTRGTGFDSRIRYFLGGVTYTNNSDFFYNCTDYSTRTNFKYFTALSSATTMNVWTCYSTEVLGWVDFLPYEVPQYSVWNGIHINYMSLPLSKTDPSFTNFGDYGDGDTLTHEAGHYLGLLHTFGDGVNGCSVGDNIADTPAEASPSIGKACKLNPPKDTCPGLPGVDPVYNIMDYSDDSCAEEFTPDQVDVMRYSVTEYKPNLILLEPPRCVADGLRGPATPMTVCKSECFVDRSAPDGFSAPQTGWCRTDAQGTWGSCCCTGACGGQPVVPAPQTLLCSRVQLREELFKATPASQLCTAADISGGPRQIYQTPCSISPFLRWVFNSDGSISNIGTGWCLTVLNFALGQNTSGLQVGLRPCAPLSPSQRFSRLESIGGVPAHLSLNADPTNCIDSQTGAFTMRPCTNQTSTQFWVRQNRPNCSVFRSRAACLNSVSTLGCSCNWNKNKCTS